MASSSNKSVPKPMRGFSVLPHAGRCSSSAGAVCRLNSHSPLTTGTGGARLGHVGGHGHGPTSGLPGERRVPPRRLHDVGVPGESRRAEAALVCRPRRFGSTAKQTCAPLRSRAVAMSRRQRHEVWGSPPRAARAVCRLASHPPWSYTQVGTSRRRDPRLYTGIACPNMKQVGSHVAESGADTSRRAEPCQCG
jgi:hypothetical protein